MLIMDECEPKNLDFLHIVHKKRGPAEKQGEERHSRERLVLRGLRNVLDLCDSPAAVGLNGIFAHCTQCEPRSKFP